MDVNHGLGYLFVIVPQFFKPSHPHPRWLFILLSVVDVLDPRLYTQALKQARRVFDIASTR